MSTRATIKITEKKDTIRIYHHHDGYPEGVGHDLKKYLGNIRYGWDAFHIANDLIKLEDDDEYELTPCIHGDEEYLYLIDCDKKELTCYAMGWDESEESIIRPSNIREIPD